MEHSIFFQLSIVLALATGVSLLCRLLRQPLVMGYIISGFVVGPAMLGIIHNREAFESFSQIGIVLLLFMVGLGLNVAVIKSTGKPVLLSFSAITALVGGLSFGMAHLLGFSSSESLVLAVALLFSSTIIVVKSLSDKKEESRLYGQIAIGVLLVEDVVATLALLFLSASSGSATAADFGLLLLKGLGLGMALSLVSVLVLPRFSKLFAASQEPLYGFALAWAFGVATAFSYAGFSIEIGALFAGVSMASLPYATEIGNRLKPLRDFFIVLFFIVLGERLGVNSLSAAIVPSLIFSAIILVTKPLVLLSSLGLLGYTKQTGFKAAVHLSQISEFSIVFVMLAVTTGLVDESLTTIMTLTALITIGLSTYLMKYDDQLYRYFQRTLAVFERRETKRELNALRHYPLILLGYQKGGHEFVQTFRRMHKRYVAIDYDPTVIEIMEHQHINHVYGDATDTELLDELGIHKSELIISTISDPVANRIIIAHVMRRNSNAIFVCHAATYEEAEYLYHKGASYVILPHFIGTEQISHFIKRHGNNKQAFEAYRRHHLATIGTIALR